MDDPPYTSAEFHNDVQKQIVAAALAALSENKLEWSQVAPILDAARSLCRDDLRLNGRLALHGQEFEGAELVEAEEAFLSISVRDRDDGLEWLSQTYWLSDVALADANPERVRAIIAALHRTSAKLGSWLEEREARLAAGAVAAEAGPAPAAGQASAGETEGPAGTW